MSIIRDFVTKLPAACGVPDGLAEIYGELNGKLFDFELANPEGPLNADNFGDVYERISLGIHPWVDLGDPYRAGYAHKLLEFVAKTTKAKGGDWEGKEASKSKLLFLEGDPANAPIASLMTVEQASTLGSWV